MIGLFESYVRVGDVFLRIGAVYGLALGIGLALLITMILIRRSNDIGDSKGTMNDFGYLYMLSSEDDLHRREPDGSALIQIEERHKEEKEYYQGKGLPEKGKLKKRRFGDGSIGEEKVTRDIFKEKFGEQE